jgi:hypothetical protein
VIVGMKSHLFTLIFIVFGRKWGWKRKFYKNKKGSQYSVSPVFILVAGIGFEPMTFGL